MNPNKIEALRILAEHGHCEYDLPEELGNDEKFMLVAIGRDSDCISWIGSELYKNKEFVHTILLVYRERWIEAIDPSDDPDPFFQGPRTPVYAKLIYDSMAEEFKADPEIMVALLSRKIEVTELHKSLIGNSEFFVKAVKFNPEIFHFADSSLKNDVDFIRAVVAVNPRIWSYLPDEQKSDEDIQEALSDIKTHILEIDLQDDEEKTRYFEFLPNEIRSDREFALEYLSKNYKFFSHLDPKLRDDLEVVRTAYHRVDKWSFGDFDIHDYVSPRIESLLDKSKLDTIETLTQAIEKQNLFGKLEAGLKSKNESKLTPRQKKAQSGPVL